MTDLPSLRAFGIVLVLALCGAGLVLARSGEQLRDQAPLVDRFECGPAASEPYRMLSDWSEVADETSANDWAAERKLVWESMRQRAAAAEAAARARELSRPATRADIAALESRILALEAALASRGIPVTSPK